MRACRGLPGGNSIFFASPKKPKEKKGDPQPGSLRCAAGTLRCSKSAEFLETSRLCRRRTSKNLFPLPSALLSPARTGWGKEVKVKADSACKRFALAGSPNPSPNPSLNPVLAGLEKKAGVGLKNLDVRRLRSRQVSKFSDSRLFFQGTAKRRRLRVAFLFLRFLWR